LVLDWNHSPNRESVNVIYQIENELARPGQPARGGLFFAAPIALRLYFLDSPKTIMGRRVADDPG